jgi:hypothetical protein
MKDRKLRAKKANRKTEISIGSIVEHKYLGRCIVTEVKEAGADLTPLWQKGDVIADEDGNPIGLVTEEGDGTEHDGGHRCDFEHTTSTRPAPGTGVRNLSLEQRDAIFEKHRAAQEAENSQKAVAAALEELGL